MTENDHNHAMGTDGSDDVESLLGAYVLDALADVDRHRVDRMLADDPVLRAEADRLSAAADQLAEAAAASGPAAPAGLWDTIAAQLDDKGADSTMAATSSVAAATPMTTSVVPDEDSEVDRVDGGVPSPDGTSNVVSIDRRRSRRSTGWLVGAAAAAVLVIAGAVAVGARIGEDDTDPMVALREQVALVASEPGSRTAALVDADETMAVDVVVDTSGHAFVMTDELPRLSPGATYQLWSVDGGTPISLGLVSTDSPMAIVGADGQVQRLALTLEPAGGSAAPTSVPMASGILSEA